MKKAIELLKACFDIFEEMDAIVWNENSSWQPSSYVEIATEVYQFIEKLEPCECLEFQSCEKCAIENKYQAAIEEINGIIAVDSKNPNLGWMQSSEITLHQEEILNKIYAITNRDFGKMKTEWVDILTEAPLFGKRYWIRDKNNNIEIADFEGHSEKGYGFFKLNTMDFSDMVVVMFAEIKPPKAP